MNTRLPIDSSHKLQYTQAAMNILTLGIIVVLGIIALFIIGRFLAGCFVRLLLFAIIIAIAAFLIYRFVLG